MTLHEDQFLVIQSIVDSAGFTSSTLKEDVLDHLCCAVEGRIQSGESFDIALEHALYDLAPQGLENIQYETDLLLSTNMVPMKKVMYSIGLASSMSFTMGLMMKLLHMPGGEELVNYGFLTFLLVFMPMLAMTLYRSYLRRELHERLRLAFALISAVLTGCAILFKISLNLEWGEMTLISGASVFAFGFLPLHFYSMYKKEMLPSA